jgi:hypothetical protein
MAAAIAAVALLVGGQQFLMPAMPGPAEGQRAALAWLWLSSGLTIGALVLGVAIIALLPPLLLSRRDRNALAVSTWLGARESRRLLGGAHRAFVLGLPNTPARAEKWLAKHPDDDALRPLRVEILELARRYDEARAAIDRLPDATPIDRYRIAEARAVIDDLQTGRHDLSAVKLALEALPPGIDRSEASASLAVFDARRSIGRGDWRAPLLDARPQLREGDLGILIRDLGIPLWTVYLRRVVLPVAVLIIVLAGAITVWQVSG